MGLPNVFSKKHNQKNDLFISILLTEKSVSSAFWKVSSQGISILNQSKSRFFQTEQEQQNQCDQSLQDLGEESEETDQTLFALEPEWASQTKIKDDYDKKLQLLCKDFSLEAVGFVLTTDALINHLLQKNAYLSNLVLYVGATSLTLVTIYQGKQQSSLSVGRSDNILSDVQEALARLNNETESSGKKLPLNITLAAASEEAQQLYKYQQRLISIDWTREFGLVQTPVIDVVGPEDLLEMVVKHAGLAVAQDKGLVPLTKQSAETTQTSNSDATNLTFDDQANQPSRDFTSSPKEDQENLPTSFGVPIGNNQINTTDEPDSNVKQPSAVFGQDQAQQQPQKGKKRDSTAPLSNKKGPKKKNFKLIALAGIFLGLVVSVAISYFLMSNSYRVSIDIKPTMQVLDKEVVITLDPQIAQSDPQQSLLKADLIYEEVTDTTSIQTTGITLVGEKAQGEVRILNKTDADKVFAKGTVLSADSLEFVLDEEVEVPAATVEVEDGGSGERKEYGQVEVTVTAKEIGTESNISEETDLQIESFSDNTYSARTIANFEGGSSREIRVVAEADLQELLVSLRQRLLKEAQDKFTQEKTSNNPVVSTDNFDIVSQEYSAEIGDEEDSVSLTLTLRLQGLSYDLSDLNELAKEVLEDEVPDNYRFLDGQENLLRDIQEIEGEDDQIMIEAEISASFEGVVNEEELFNELRGISIQEAESILSNHERISNYQLTLTPRIAQRFFKSVPQESDRLILTID